MLSPFTSWSVRSFPLNAPQAAKKYEEHCAANGKPDSHAKAKELMAAFSGAFIDRMVESKVSHIPSITLPSVAAD
jgi:hypothetical protein